MSPTRKKASRRRKEKAGSGLGEQVVPVNHLHLDLSNYRHEPVSSEAEAIAHLCASEDVLGLIHDIIRRGHLSPLETLGVVPMSGNPGHYTVVEGNRRTCALLLAADPSRAPSTARDKVRQLVGSNEGPARVKVHVFPGKEDAKPWIDLRHLGPQNGAGLRRWTATQKNRAAKGDSKSTARANTLAVLVLDRLVQLDLLSSDERKGVSVTTLTRYLNTPGVRAIVGLASNKELRYTHDYDQVDLALLQMVNDMLNPQQDGSYSVHSRSSSAERLQYANDMKSKGKAPSTLLDSPAQPPDPATTKKQQQKSKKKRRSNRHPDKRKYLFPPDFVLVVRDSVLLRLRGEAATLDAESYSFCATFILRAFIERTMVMFLRKRGKWNENLTDRSLTERCSKELCATRVPRGVLDVVRKAAGSSDTPYSLHSMGHAIHGGSIPTGTDVKRYFDTWRPALEAMLDTLE